MWGRKIYYRNELGEKVPRILVHLKMPDRTSNWELFRKLYVDKCLKVCKESVTKANRKMQPRIPSETVLEGLRPNNCKYFKGASFGECSICKPCYDNYMVFLRLVHETNPEVHLAINASQYVRGRVCENTKGKARHRCEDNLCKNCSFINYFVNDPSVEPEIADKRGAIWTFSSEVGVEFLMDTIIEWSEYEMVGEDLPGKRKYDHLLYKNIKGTVNDFLMVFQRQCSRMKPHKFYQHEQSKRKIFSRTVDNDALRTDVVALYGDYSQNAKKRSCRSGATEQYRDMPDFSLLNINTFFREGSLILRVDYHCISEDPKHDTNLWPASLNQVIQRILKKRPHVSHFEVTTDTSKKEFKAVSVFKRVADIAVATNKTFMISTFGPQHGKFLYDAAGSV